MLSSAARNQIDMLPRLIQTGSIRFLRCQGLLQQHGSKGLEVLDGIPQLKSAMSAEQIEARSFVRRDVLPWNPRRFLNTRRLSLNGTT